MATFTDISAETYLTTSPALTTPTAGENFFLSAFDTTISATKMTLPEGSDTSAFGADVYANINIDVAFAQTWFQFWTDAIDINNVDEDDLLFKLDTLSSGIVSPAEAKPYFDYIGDSTTPEYSLGLGLGLDFSGVGYDFSGTALETRNKVADEFIRYIAYNVFGTADGVDLFNNEIATRNALINDSKAQFLNKYNEFMGPSASPHIYTYGATDVSGSIFPTTLIFKQIMSNQPARFIDALSGTGTYAIGDGWYKMPLMVGDKLFFKLTIQPDAAQKSFLSGSTAIADRTYRIRLTLV